MQLSEGQFKILSQYFADISKILVASVVVGFFLPSAAGQISIPVFIVGSVMAFVTLVASINIFK
ncbi:hypothetical protein HYZ64_03065 [Candidatus Berkelbacteria bacterium]|nr:hypothetical protein [Candidatus Berkelbacteria bacterium]